MKKWNGERRGVFVKGLFSSFLLLYSVCFILLSCASAASAEEYYSIGMAYYDMGKFSEAQRWLERANSVKTTMRASEYNLGRIAFETKKYTIAAQHFENILKDDGENVMALKSIAYTKIMLGDIDGAEAYYERVLKLEPESADDGYNYAMILYAMQKYPEAEAVLKKFSYDMPDNKNTLLLLARAEKAQNKVEAIDDYALWFVKNTDPLVRYEYAEALETATYYARAIEELKKALEGWTGGTETATVKKGDVQYKLAYLLLTADNNNDEGIAILKEAVSGGFADLESVNELAKDARVSSVHKEEISVIAGDVAAKLKTAEAQAAEPPPDAAASAATPPAIPETGQTATP
ncbi:MAG: tetratricopeptide repeat protein [Spirochaetaceae bacterium]|nr:tetratricopeptide repeat protein [Spirochaetaceae bacterium]